MGLYELLFGKKDKVMEKEAEIKGQKTLTEQEFYGSLTVRQKRIYDSFSSQDGKKEFRRFIELYRKEGETIKELEKSIHEANLLLI